MNKKLIAVAVAGLFVAPAAALAQSSVTISGKLMTSFGGYSLANRAVGGLGRSSETMLKDESSRVIFQMREDLGGGLAAIGKVDLRPSLTDNGLMGPTGESFVGLTSPTWGTIAMGRFDFHYGNHASYTGTHGGLMTNPTAVFDVAAAGAVALANQTRTNNAIRYGSPKWGDMFEVVVGYSSAPTAASNAPGLLAVTGIQSAGAATGATQNENDLRQTARKGQAWNVNPKLYGKNWEAGYSWWRATPEITQAVPSTSGTNGGTNNGIGLTPNSAQKHRGDSLYGTYQWGGFRAGLAWNRSKIDLTNISAAPVNFNTSAGVLASGSSATISNRTVWGIPLAYTWGNHNVYLDWYRAGADKAANFAGLDTKAKFLGLAYAYDLSKRTTAAVSYTKITNGANAGYNLFTAATPGGTTGLGNPQAVAAGEDPRFVAVTLQHRF